MKRPGQPSVVLSEELQPTAKRPCLDAVCPDLSTTHTPHDACEQPDGTTQHGSSVPTANSNDECAPVATTAADGGGGDDDVPAAAAAASSGKAAAASAECAALQQHDGCVVGRSALLSAATPPAAPHPDAQSPPPTQQQQCSMQPLLTANQPLTSSAVQPASVFEQVFAGPDAVMRATESRSTDQQHFPATHDVHWLLDDNPAPANSDQITGAHQQQLSNEEQLVRFWRLFPSSAQAIAATTGSVTADSSPAPGSNTPASAMHMPSNAPAAGNSSHGSHHDDATPAGDDTHAPHSAGSEQQGGLTVSQLEQLLASQPATGSSSSSRQQMTTVLALAHMLHPSLYHTDIAQLPVAPLLLQCEPLLKQLRDRVAGVGSPLQPLNAAQQVSALQSVLALPEVQAHMSSKQVEVVQAQLAAAKSRFEIGGSNSGLALDSLASRCLPHSAVAAGAAGLPALQALSNAQLQHAAPAAVSAAAVAAAATSAMEGAQQQQQRQHQQLSNVVFQGPASAAGSAFAAAAAAAAAATAPSGAATGAEQLTVGDAGAGDRRSTELPRALRMWARLCVAVTSAADVDAVPVAWLLPHVDTLLQSLRQDVEAARRGEVGLQPLYARHYLTALHSFLQKSREQLQQGVPDYDQLFNKIQALQDEFSNGSQTQQQWLFLRQQQQRQQTQAQVLVAAVQQPAAAQAMASGPGAAAAVGGTAASSDAALLAAREQAGQAAHTDPAVDGAPLAAASTVADNTSSRAAVAAQLGVCDGSTALLPFTSGAAAAQMVAAAAAAAASIAPSGAATGAKQLTVGQALALTEQLTHIAHAKTLSAALCRWVRVCFPQLKAAAQQLIYAVPVAWLLPRVDIFLQSVRQDVAAARQGQHGWQPSTARTYLSALHSFLHRSRQELQQGVPDYRGLLDKIQALLDELSTGPSTNQQQQLQQPQPQQLQHPQQQQQQQQQQQAAAALLLIVPASAAAVAVAAGAIGGAEPSTDPVPPAAREQIEQAAHTAGSSRAELMPHNAAGLQAPAAGNSAAEADGAAETAASPTANDAGSRAAAAASAEGLHSSSTAPLPLPTPAAAAPALAAAAAAPSDGATGAEQLTVGQAIALAEQSAGITHATTLSAALCRWVRLSYPQLKFAAQPNILGARVPVAGLLPHLDTLLLSIRVDAQAAAVGRPGLQPATARSCLSALHAFLQRCRQQLQRGVPDYSGLLDKIQALQEEMSKGSPTQQQQTQAQVSVQQAAAAGALASGSTADAAVPVPVQLRGLTNVPAAYALGHTAPSAATQGPSAAVRAAAAGGAITAAAAAAAAQAEAVAASAAIAAAVAAAKAEEAVAAGTQPDVSAAAAAACAASSGAAGAGGMTVAQAAADKKQLLSALRKWARLCFDGEERADVDIVPVADLLPHIDTLLQSLHALGHKTACNYLSALHSFLKKSRQQLQQGVPDYDQLLAKVKGLYREMKQPEKAAKATAAQAQAAEAASDTHAAVSAAAATELGAEASHDAATSAAPAEPGQIVAGADKGAADEAVAITAATATEAATAPQAHVLTLAELQQLVPTDCQDGLAVLLAVAQAQAEGTTLSAAGVSVVPLLLHCTDADTLAACEAALYDESAEGGSQRQYTEGVLGGLIQLLRQPAVREAWGQALCEDRLARVEALHLQLRAVMQALPAVNA